MANIRKLTIGFIAVAMLTLGACTTYQYQRTVPGSDGIVYVQGAKIVNLVIFTQVTPTIWKCTAKGENLNCDKPLQFKIDNDYWKSNYHK